MRRVTLHDVGGQTNFCHPHVRGIVLLVASSVDANQILADAHDIPMAQDSHPHEHFIDERTVRAAVVANQIEVTGGLHLGMSSRDACVWQRQIVAGLSTDGDNF